MYFWAPVVIGAALCLIAMLGIILILALARMRGKSLTTLWSQLLDTFWFPTAVSIFVGFAYLHNTLARMERLTRPSDPVLPPQSSDCWKYHTPNITVKMMPMTLDATMTGLSSNLIAFSYWWKEGARVEVGTMRWEKDRGRYGRWEDKNGEKYGTIQLFPIEGSPRTFVGHVGEYLSTNPMTAPIVGVLLQQVPCDK